MRSMIRHMLVFAVLIAGGLAVLTAFADPAEARHRRHVVHPTAYIVDDWGRCWVRSRSVWWLTVCDRRFGAAARPYGRYW